MSLHPKMGMNKTHGSFITVKNKSYTHENIFNSIIFYPIHLTS